MLEINDLRVVYPNGYEALKSVTLTAGNGEIVNGCSTHDHASD